MYIFHRSWDLNISLLLICIVLYIINIYTWLLRYYYIYWGFLKSGYVPPNHPFKLFDFHCKPLFLGYLHLWTPPVRGSCQKRGIQRNYIHMGYSTYEYTVYIYIYSYKSRYVYIYIYIYIHIMCVYIYICIYTYLYIYTHIM